MVVELQARHRELGHHVEPPIAVHVFDPSARDMVARVIVITAASRVVTGLTGAAQSERRGLDGRGIETVRAEDGHDYDVIDAVIDDVRKRLWRDIDGDDGRIVESLFDEGIGGEHSARLMCRR